MYIPYSFIREHADISWQEALWGVNHRMVELPEVVELAKDRVFAGSDDPRESELAWLNPLYTYRIDELLRELVTPEGDVDETLIQKKWLYLTLFWMFEHRAEIDDPLTEVEVVYADFDYPEEIETFVRYKSQADGITRMSHSHSKEEIEQRMMGKWLWYLDQAKAQFGRQRGAM